MTKLEEAEMQELGMTPEKLKAKRDEIAALLQEETTRPTKPQSGSGTTRAEANTPRFLSQHEGSNADGTGELCPFNAAVRFPKRGQHWRRHGRAGGLV